MGFTEELQMRWWHTSGDESGLYGGGGPVGVQRLEQGRRAGDVGGGRRCTTPHQIGVVGGGQDVDAWCCDVRLHA